MGNVGNIEKVMVFGILAIIICILCIAVWGHNVVSDPDHDIGTGVTDIGDVTPPRSGFGLKVNKTGPGGDDDPALLPNPPEDDEIGPLTVNEPDPVPPEATLPRTYTIQSGDTYSGLAARFFNDANLWTEFEKVNEDFDANRLREGMVVNVPQLVLAESVPFEPEAPAPEVLAPRTESKTYVVQDGDTLSGISRKFYRTPNNWRSIADANTDVLPNPDRLKAGIELRIP